MFAGRHSDEQNEVPFSSDDSGRYCIGPLWPQPETPE
jgi:hypothetical protein